MNTKIQKFMDALFADSSLNRLPGAYGGGRIFDTPVVGVAKGDDPIFEKFKQRVGRILKPHHRVIDGQEQISHPVGCAFCQFDVPCMDRNPVSSA